VSAGLAVALAGRGAVDDPSLLRAFEAVGDQARVVLRCADLAELLACAATGAIHVAVVASSLRRLDRDALAAMHAHRVRVVVVCASAADADAWHRCGADAVLTDDDPAAVVGAALSAPPPPALPGPGRLTEAVGPVGSPSDASTGAAGPSAAGRTLPGRIVAVWGPTGAPGRTTVAVALADELARAGRATLLVDADTYGAAVGIHLGLLDDTSGLAAVTRLAALGRLDAPSLRRAAVVVGAGRLSVLTGLARPSRWPELRQASVQAVLELATGCFDTVVVDLGFGLGTGATPGSGIGPPDRDDATRAVLAVCDTLVTVGAGDTVGIVRLARELDAVTDCAPSARRCVVVNRCRRSSLGARPLRQASEVLGRQVAPGSLRALPDDQASCDAALLGGRTLAEVAPDSALRRAVRALAHDVDPQLPAAGRREARRIVRLRGLAGRGGARRNDAPVVHRTG
jgi:Mrp family chromosome partitioning ATPase